MPDCALFPTPDGLEVTATTVTPSELVVSLVSLRPTSICPQCSTMSSRIHSTYVRHPRDLPCIGRPVRVLLTVKKFVCGCPTCPQKLFAERLPDMIAVSSRLTCRLREGVQSIGFATTGKGGERLSSRLGAPVSDATILRSLYLAPLPQPPVAPQIIGIDDWSYRRGQRFGSIVVDLQTHAIVDLLPDQTTDSVVCWLQQHPTVHTISRDRGAVYVDGATQGTPDATQVCDRWHLLANLGDAVEAYLIRTNVRLPEHAHVQPTTDRPLTMYSATPAQQRGTQARLLRKDHLTQQIHDLHAQGKSARAISRELGLARATVSKYVHRPLDPVLPTPRPPRFSMLDAYDALILDHLRQGCRNAAAIHRAMVEQGFQGGPTNVRAYVKYLCTTSVDGRSPVTRTQRAQSLSPRCLRWLLTKPCTALSETDQHRLDALLSTSSEMQLVYAWVQSFQKLVRERQAEQLQTWMDEGNDRGIPEFKRFVSGLERDHAAVYQALCLPWSQGPVEGTINKLKTLKRMMYGRASFPLLRLRLLHGA